MEGDWSEIDAQFQKLSMNARFGRGSDLNQNSSAENNNNGNVNAPPGIPLPNGTQTGMRKISSGSYDSNLAVSLHRGQNSGNNEDSGNNMHFRQNSLPTYSHLFQLHSMGTGNNSIDVSQGSHSGSLIPQSPIGTRTLSSTSSTCSPSPTLSDGHGNLLSSDNSSFLNPGRSSVGLPPKPRPRSTSLASQGPNAIPSTTSGNPSLGSSSDLSSFDRMRSYSADTLLAQHTNSVHKRTSSLTAEVGIRNSSLLHAASSHQKLEAHASQSMPNLDFVNDVSKSNQMQSNVIGSSNTMSASSGNFSSQHAHVTTHSGYANNMPVPAPGYVNYGNPYEMYTNYPPGYIQYRPPNNGPPGAHTIINTSHAGPYPAPHGHMYIHSMHANMNNSAVMASEGDIIRATSGNMVGHHSSQASSMLATNVANKQIMVYQVKFKRLTKSYLLASQQKSIQVGSYVVVQADRGEDLGMVIARSPLDRFKSKESELKYILRGASQDEVSLLPEKYSEESVLLKICRSKVKQRKLNMKIIDAEYQFDRHKLTFYFEAEGRVDFRELVRDLFSVYKTRIWMQQVDKNCSVVIEDDE